MFEDEKSITAPSDRPLRLWIEPWAEAHEFLAGTVVTLRARSTQEGRLEVVPAEDATWIYGWTGSTLEILVGGERVVLFDLPPPSLPAGMSMRGFVGGVLGANPKMVAAARTDAPPPSMPPELKQGVVGAPPERAGNATSGGYSCSFIESIVVLAAVGFALGMGGGGIAQLIDGRYALGLTFVVTALLPFGAWAVIRWIVLRKAGS